MNVAELIMERNELRSQIGKLADECAKEERARSEQEEKEYQHARARMQQIDMMLEAREVINPAARAVEAESVYERARRRLLDGRPMEMRAGGGGSNGGNMVATPLIEDTGLLVVDQQEMLAPLRGGLIYDKLGITIRTGNVGTQLRWACRGIATAYFRGEGDIAQESGLLFDKLSIKPETISLAVPVTREALEGSAGVVETAVREEMPLAVADCINKAMFTTDATMKCAGPFANAGSTKVAFAAALPTRKELLKMVAAVTKNVGRLTAGAWVVSPEMAAELRDTKVDEGSGRFLIENDTMLGYPVFETGDINAKNIGFGDWSYQAGGFFGDWTVTADPYTLLRRNTVDFVLHASWGAVTLKPEAFALGTAK